MRVIAGKLGGREFRAPPGHRTHPMSDKVRGALFNMLGDIEGLSLLDAFAGSGACTFEAISRGVAQATAIDVDKAANTTIVNNLKLLGLADQVKAIRANVSSWSDNNPAAKFDMVLAAPPYDDLQISVVQKLVHHLKPAGTFILDWPGKLVPPELERLQIIAAKRYGDAQLVFYRPV